METLKKLPIFCSEESCSYGSGNRDPEKNSLYFRKQNFLIFQETLKNFPNSKETF